MIQQLQDVEIESMIKVYESGVNILMPYTLTELFIEKERREMANNKIPSWDVEPHTEKLISIT